MKPHILIVEDEKDIVRLISLQLQDQGFDTSSCENGEEALKLLQQKKMSLVILDWMLPGLSGIDLCRQIRSDKEKSFSDIPILLLTARAELTDIVHGLSAGADDYVIKPFDCSVLLARVNALLRRATLFSSSNSLRYENLRVDLEAHEVTVRGEPVSLTGSEFRLLVALLQNQGRVLTRERLIDLVQGDDVSVVDRAIDIHIFGLRKKLGEHADIVQTVRGVGYRIRSA